MTKSISLIISVFLLIPLSLQAQDTVTVERCAKSQLNPDSGKFREILKGDVIRFTPISFTRSTSSGKKRINEITIYHDRQTSINQGDSDLYIQGHRTGVLTLPRDTSYDFTVTGFQRSTTGDVTGLLVQSKNGHGYTIKTLYNSKILTTWSFIPTDQYTFPEARIVREGRLLTENDAPPTYLPRSCNKVELEKLQEINFPAAEEQENPGIAI